MNSNRDEKRIFDVSTFPKSHINYLKKLKSHEFAKIRENYGNKFDKFDSTKHRKCHQKSFDLRTTGNQLFQKGKYEDSLLMYSKAVSFAPFDCEDQCLAISFSNRSAALFYLKRYSECLQDIEYAFSFKCPDKIAQKLLKRKQSCVENAQSSATEEIIDFKYNENIFGVSNCVDIGNVCGSSERTLKVNRNMKKGELLIKQAPFACVLTPKRYKHNCYFCLRPLPENTQFPCKKCTQVSFCNNQCSEECWEKYHKHECCYLELLNFSADFHLQPKLALITLLTAGIENVLNVLHGTESTINYSSLNYKAIYSLMDHSDSCPDFTPPSNLIVLFLSKTFPKLNSDKIALLGCVVLKHIQQIHVNGKYIYERTLKPLPQNSDLKIVEDVKIGCGLYETFSLVNHSCNPNCLTYMFDGRTLLVKALRNITSGEELSICYGSNCKWQTTTRRQSFLQQYYFFNCKCWACVHDVNSVTKAVVCEFCDGAAIIEETFVKCLVCKAVNNSNAEIVNQRVKDIENALNLCAEMVNNEDCQKAEVLLKQIDEKASKLFYKDNKLFQRIFDMYSSLYKKMNNFDASVQYAEKALQNVRKSFSEDYYPVFNSMIKLIDTQVCLLKNTSRDSDKFSEMANSCLGNVEKCEKMLASMSLPTSQLRHFYKSLFSDYKQACIPE